MDGSHVCDHPDIRLRNFPQRADLTGMRHSHLDDRHIVFRFKPQQHEGKAKVIVEIAFGLKHA